MKILDTLATEYDRLTGNATRDKVFTSQFTYPDDATAQLAFDRAVRRLLDLNAWSDLPGLTTAFQRVDPTGVPLPTPTPAVGDFVRIQLPGPVPANWGQITVVRVADSLAELTIQPSHAPDNSAADAPIAHFFGPESTSTIRVTRTGPTLVAQQIGLDERINNQGEQAGDRPVLNTLVAEVGWAFFQHLQWQKIIDYLIAPEPAV